MSSQDLENLLAGLREQTRGVEAPKRVEAALLGAFRAESRRPARHMWMRWALGAAAAVAVILGAGVITMQQPAAPPPAVKVAVAPPPPIVQPAPKIVPPVVAKRVRRAPRPRVQTPPPVQEVATDFLPLDDTATLPPIESGHIMRVRLPQSTMMRFGFPINPDRMMDPVKADVMFGQDGIARAVRFVK
jgi:hypothetical protein